MKKAVVVFVVVFAWSLQGFGQNVNQVITQLSKNENVETISVGSVGMFFSKLLGASVGGKEGLEGLKGLKSLELLVVKDECPADQKKKIWNQLKNLKDDKEYATLMQVKDGDDFVRFLGKKAEKDTIKDILMIVLSKEENGSEDMVVIRLKGQFKASDVAKWTEKRNQKGNGQ
ncbi:MAG: DUF4252 domain-containing protein [Dysgonamonadaceae bacterium]|jgi:hypothetical protein|nr:DUF4252 domain-containing protein [Dysgonamonadaceae bacterium]